MAALNVIAGPLKGGEDAKRRQAALDTHQYSRDGTDLFVLNLCSTYGWYHVGIYRA